MTRAQRAALIAMANSVIPALVLFGLVVWTPEQVAAVMGIISLAITSSAYFIPGSQPEPEPQVTVTVSEPETVEIVTESIRQPEPVPQAVGLPGMRRPS